MTANHILGRQGEKLACDYLQKINYHILDKNWRFKRYGEIDIIAVDRSTKELVFIEIKSRETSINDAKELVTIKKQHQIYKLAKSYLFLKKKEDCTCRFDVIAIKINKEGKQLEHMKNAFYL